MTHLMERAAEDDQLVWVCTCQHYLGANYAKARAAWEDHLAEDVVADDPLQELALIEAKQRHPSQRGLT